jgi:EAL domain-containing protein (putative c-di-GMP-specific phosphodiesterase class I)
MSKTGETNPCAGCKRCEVLPHVMQGAAHLYLWLPLGHSAGKVRRMLTQWSLEHEQLDGQALRVMLEAGQQEDFAAELSQVLMAQEIADTRALWMEEGRLPGLADMAQIMPLRQFLGRSQGNWLLDLLREERLTSHFQPIVRADDTSVIFAQEALLRGLTPDNAIISLGKVFDAARDAGLLFQLDLAARRSAIAHAGRHAIDSHIFINFNPTAIYDPNFCLRTTVQAIHEMNLDSSRVVFEIIESDRSADISHLRRITDYYRAAGFQIAMDDMGAGYSSLNMIHQLRPDYIKLDMELIRDVHQDPYKAMIAQKMLEIALELGIKTVAEGVECLEELAWVQAHGATYVQGYLIAKPSATPVRETPHLSPNQLRWAA